MSSEKKFKRYEVKFKITKDQYEKIKEIMCEHMKPDEHGKSTIFSLYFDTPDFQLIRRSMEHPVYKEKLRMRSYGVVDEDHPVFLELKKKYDKVVYKRRIELTEKEAFDFCEGIPETGNQERSFNDEQIRSEIRYALGFYNELRPRMLLSYEREAWYDKDDHDFRVTFDENLLWRETDLDLHTGVYGKRILPENEMIMEIKTSKSIPLWMTEILTGEKIYKTSFSKYATAYTQKIKEEMLERALETQFLTLLEDERNRRMRERNTFRYTEGRQLAYA